MFMFKKKLEMPSAAEALPGRSTPIPTAREHFVLHRPIKGPYPEGLETAVFGLGCFWGAERKFWELGDGIYTTAVGYAGGHTPNPTYEEVCSGRTGHNEVVLVVYDPKKISYERLLKTFSESHDPTQGMRQGNDVGTQYRSGIYTFTPEQRKAAEASKAMYDKELKARRFDAVTQFPKLAFGAPEAAQAEHRGLEALWIRPLDWTVKDKVLPRGRDRGRTAGQCLGGRRHFKLLLEHEHGIVLP